MQRPIQINSKEIVLLKPYTSADYMCKTVLTDSCWEYVELWLKRQLCKDAADALFYWQQAKHFYTASNGLPENAKPLTSYYCILNATKALLCYHGLNVNNISHGIGNNNRQLKNTNRSLKNAMVTVNTEEKSVMFLLSKYLGDSINKRTYSVFDLLYNIPCIHRAFCITFKGTSELFIPIKEPRFVYDDKINEAWLVFELTKRYSNKRTLTYLPKTYKQTKNFNNTSEFSIRKNGRRIYWNIHTPKNERMIELSKYHGKVRKNLFFISGTTKLWYIKKELPKNKHVVEMCSMTLIFAVMHWLSELVRYNPKRFESYMSSKQNWLFHEFIEKALDQFIDEISCEITKEEIMVTGYRK